MPCGITLVLYDNSYLHCKGRLIEGVCAGPGDEPLAGIPLQQLGGLPVAERQAPSPPVVLSQAAQPPAAGSAERAGSFAFPIQAPQALPSQVCQNFCLRLFFKLFGSFLWSEPFLVPFLKTHGNIIQKGTLCTRLGQGVALPLIICLLKG
jgi:hypothetical protein